MWRRLGMVHSRLARSLVDLHDEFHFGKEWGHHSPLGNNDLQDIELPFEQANKPHWLVRFESDPSHLWWVWERTEQTCKSIQQNKDQRLGHCGSNFQLDRQGTAD